MWVASIWVFCKWWGRGDLRPVFAGDVDVRGRFGKIRSGLRDFFGAR